MEGIIPCFVSYWIQLQYKIPVHFHISKNIYLPVPIMRCVVPRRKEFENLQLSFEAKYLQAIFKKNKQRKLNYLRSEEEILNKVLKVHN